MSLDKKREILENLEQLTDDIEDEFYDLFMDDISFHLERINYYIFRDIEEIEQNLLEQKNDDIPL